MATKIVTGDERYQFIDCPPEIRPLLPKILPPIERMVKETVDASYSGERLLQLLRLQRSDYFYRGIQNIAPSLDPSAGVVGWTTFGPTLGSSSRDAELMAQSFDYNPRLTKSYGDKFVAVLGERPFYNTTAEAADPNEESDRRGARQVNLLLQMLHSQMNVQFLQKQVCYYLYKCGTTFGLVKPETDAKKFGSYQVPNLVPHQQCQCGQVTPGMPPGNCPQCGAPFGPPMSATIALPDQNEPKKSYPRTSVVLHILNGYTVTMPFNVLPTGRSPWYINQCEKDKGEILQAFPQARVLVGAQAGASLSGEYSDATAATVRAAAQSQTGTIRTRNLNNWSFGEKWIDASQWELLDDDIRDLVKQAFPDGMRLVQANNTTVALYPENYLSVLSWCQPAMADYLWCDGACWSMLGLEDAFSNLLNIMMEFLETGIPTYITNPDYVNADALNRSRYSPNKAVNATPKYGENIANNWGTVLPTSRYPDQVPEAFQVIKDLIENSIGLLPQVYGQMPGNLTLGQARMMLSQGLMQLSVVAGMLTKFWEQTDTNAVNLYCQVAQTNPEFQGQTIDLDAIRNSAWNIKGDTSMPRSFGERVESLRQLLTETPQVAEQLKIGTPINASKMRDYLDLPDFDDPDVDMIDAMNEIIDQLWQSQPIEQPPPPPGPPDPLTGMPAPPPPPAPPQPSIQFDGSIFDPQVTVELCRASLLKAMTSPNKARNQNSPGFANVKAFMMQAQQAVQPPPLPPPPLKLSMALDKTPPEQEIAILHKYGLDIPPAQNPSMDALNKMDVEVHKHALHGPEKLAERNQKANALSSAAQLMDDQGSSLGPQAPGSQMVQ